MLTRLTDMFVTVSRDTPALHAKQVRNVLYNENI